MKIKKIWFSDDTFEKMSGASQADPLYEAISKGPNNIDIVFEDDDMIIINKPSGIKSQK